MSVITTQNFESGTDSPPTSWVEVTSTGCSVVWNESHPGSPPPGLGNYCISCEALDATYKHAYARYDGTTGTPRTDSANDFCFYVDTEGFSTGQYCRIFQNIDTTYYMGLRLYLKDNDGTGDLRIKMDHYHGSNIDESWQTASLSTGKWYFVKTWYDATSASYDVWSCDNGHYEYVCGDSYTGGSGGLSTKYGYIGIVAQTGTSTTKIYFDSFTWATTAAETTQPGIGYAEVAINDDTIYRTPNKPWLPDPDGHGGCFFYEDFPGNSAAADQDMPGWASQTTGSGVLTYNSTGGPSAMGPYSLYSHVTTAYEYAYARYNFYSNTPGADISDFYLQFYCSNHTWPNTGTGYFFMLRDSTPTLIFGMGLNAVDHKIYAYVKNGAGWDSGATASAITQDTRYRIDIKYDASANSFIVQVNGTTIVTSTSATPGDIRYMDVGCNDQSNATNTMYFDSIAIRQQSVYDGYIGAIDSAVAVLTDDVDTHLMQTAETTSYLLFGTDNIATNDRLATPACVRVHARLKQYSAERHYLYLIATTDTTPITQSQTGYRNHSAKAAIKEVYADFYEDPDAAKGAWTYSNLDDLMIGLYSHGATNIGGAKLAKVFARVLHGNAGDAFFTHGPRFIATDTSITMTFRTHIIGTGTRTTNVKVRYSKSSSYLEDPNTGTLNTNYWETSSQVATISSDQTTWDSEDGWLTFEMTGLDTDTLYYFDPIIEQDNGIYMSTYEFERAMGNPSFGVDVPMMCTTDPSTSSTAAWRYAAIGDMHAGGADGESPIHYSIMDQIAADSPDFLVDLGDEFHYTAADGLTLAEFRKAYRAGRGYHCEAVHLQENLTGVMPCYETVSDHNFGSNDYCKIGYGKFGSLTYQSAQFALKALFECTPMPRKTEHLQVTAAAGGSSTELYTSDTIPTTGTTGIYPGAAVHNITDGSLGEVKATDSSNPKVVLCEALYGGTSNTFADGDVVVIARGGLWYAKDYANARLIFIDSRSKRDADFSPGGDKLDGTMHGFVKNSLSKPLISGHTVDNQDTLTAVSGTTSTTIYHNNTTLESYIVAGDLVKNTTRAQYKIRYTGGTGTFAGALTWGAAGSGNTVADYATDHTVIVDVLLSGTAPASGQTITDGTKSATITGTGDFVPYKRPASQYSLVQSVTNSTGSNDGTVVLEWAIPNMVSGDVIGFFGSGASEYGSDANNIAQGHVQRTYIQAEIRDCTKDWRLIFTETPMHAYEGMGGDKWCDYDGMTSWARETNWVSDGGDLLYATGYQEKPGQVYRYVEIDYKKPSALKDVGTYDSITGLREWAYDSSTKRVYIWKESLGDMMGSYGYPYIYYPSFYDRCSIRRYIVKQYEALNAFWTAADRHIGGLQTADTENPWPTASMSPAHCRALGAHYSCQNWDVAGKDAYYERGDGTKVTDTFSTGCYGIVDVTAEMITVSLYERDGALISCTAGDAPLGDMTMNVIFSSVLVDEGFEGTGTEETWTEITT